MTNSNKNYIYASIDIETTGFDFELDEIIEIGILPLNDNFTIETQIKPFHARIEATQILERHKKALEINGLDPTEGDSNINTLCRLKAWFIHNKIDKIIPVGQNIDKFDLPFIGYWMTNIKLPIITYNDIFHHKTYDLLKLCRNLSLGAKNITGDLDYFENKHTLKNICRTCGIDYPENAHTALVDAEITAKCYRYILQGLQFRQKSNCKPSTIDPFDEKQCETCCGTGKLDPSDDYYCDDCGGTGKIKRNESVAK